MPWHQANKKIVDIMTSNKEPHFQDDYVVGVGEQKMNEEWDTSVNLEVFELESGRGQVKVTSR
jgi:hypothetical protein